MANAPARDGTKARGAARRGFTIVELLIVIAVIILLLSILTVAIAAASRTSQSASTKTLMGSIRQGLIRFKADVGYYPPILRPHGDASPDGWRQLKPPPAPGSTDFADELQEWHSETALAEYMLGYGNHDQDGYGIVPGGTWDHENPPLGIRHPGPDGVWGATINGDAQGGLGDRMDSLNLNVDSGPVFGPYIEISDARLLASTDGSTDAQGNLRVSLPGEGNYDPDLPKVILDYWGRPLRYYRRIYPIGSLGMNYRALDVGGLNPTLADVILLRPFRVAPGSETDAYVVDADGDTTASRELRSGEFAIFSPGPDRSWDATLRADSQEFNADNLVEVGP